jgi:hypothetical protein
MLLQHARHDSHESRRYRFTACCATRSPRA